jgi:hypothetical protein
MPAHALAVIELRQYRLQPGVREKFIELFDSELTHTQEAVGIDVLGRFRDLDRPDAFVWMRGFADMESRAAALHDFYFGPVWAKHRDVANSMMCDSDDVLLLEPVELDPPAKDDMSTGVVYVDVCELESGESRHRLERYRDAAAPLVRAAGGRTLATLQTLHAANTFPRLPVRDVNVAVTVNAFPSVAVAAAAFDRPDLAAAIAETGATTQRLRLTAGRRTA